MKPRFVIYITSILICLITSLKIKVSSQKMMKELLNEHFVDSLFLKLMISSDSNQYDGLLLLSTFLESEITPFRKQYIKSCRDYSIFTILSIIKQSKKWKRLNFDQIISADCISSIQIKFIQYESIILPFLFKKRILPILSNNFKPSQWSLGTFYIFVREAVDLKLKVDWSSWCGDVELSGDHFNQNLWNSNDKLWKLLNYKCIERINQRKRIIIRWKYLLIFKKRNDSPKEALMKIISITAAFIAIKKFGDFFPQEQIITEATLNFLLKSIEKKDKSGVNNEETRKISEIASIFIQFCEFDQTRSESLFTFSLTELFELLKEEPIVNSNWLLNLIYITLNISEFMADELLLIDWFFNLDPSILNICQLLEITGRFGPDLKDQIIDRLDNDLLASVYKECPMNCKTRKVPLEFRFKTLLSLQRTFPKQSLELKILYAQKDQFWYLLKIIIEKEKTIFTHNTAIFVEGFDLFTFRSLDQFFEHFLQTFLKHPNFYYVVGTEREDDKPVIIPSILIPKRVINILFSVLARSAILNFKVSFYISFDLFKTAFEGQKRRFHGILRLKKKFYFLKNIDNEYANDCNLINRSQTNTRFLVEHLIRVSKSKSSTSLDEVISDSTIYKLIESQQEGIQRSVENIFSSNVVFSPVEMYSLIFKR